MSMRPCSALCSALTVEMPPKPPPTTRILLRALLHIAVSPVPWESLTPLTEHADGVEQERRTLSICLPHSKLRLFRGGVLILVPGKVTYGSTSNLASHASGVARGLCAACHSSSAYYSAV